MNLYITLAIILRLLLVSRIESAELPMFNAGNFVMSQLVPLTYRRSFGQRPFQGCVKCAQNLQLNAYPSRSGQNSGVPQIYNTEKSVYRRIYDADEPHIDLHMPAHLKRPLISTGKDLLWNTTHLINQINDYMNFKNVEHVAVTESTNLVPYKDPSITIFNKPKPMYFGIHTPKVIGGETSTKHEEGTTTNSVNSVSTSKITSVGLDTNFKISEEFVSVRGISLNFVFDNFEYKFYEINFDKFLALSPPNRDSGMSFVQSGLFLALALIAFSAEVGPDTKAEIDQMLGMPAPYFTDLDKINLTRRIISSLPKSKDGLHFRWSTHLVLGQGREVSDQFKSGAAAALQLKIDHFERNQTPAAMAEFLNHMIEEDSGAIRDTFEEGDLRENEEAVLITTLYFRARWRSAPTLLNGTWNFGNAQDVPTKTVRMIRINDVMKYANIPEWNAEVVEIPYQTQGLTLLVLVPNGNSLKPLVNHVTRSHLSSIIQRMKPIRIAVRLPLYTLRMTLLLPNKLQAMGFTRLVNVSEAADSSLRLSQAVQRIMFWAEAGRNAFKDDGLEWDEAPEKELLVDRPYIFYVRWHNLTIMHGNFAL